MIPINTLKLVNLLNQLIFNFWITNPCRETKANNQFFLINNLNF